VFFIPNYYLSPENLFLAVNDKMENFQNRKKGKAS